MAPLAGGLQLTAATRVHGAGLLQCRACSHALASTSAAAVHSCGGRELSSLVAQPFRTAHCSRAARQQASSPICQGRALATAAEAAPSIDSAAQSSAAARSRAAGSRAQRTSAQQELLQKVGGRGWQHQRRRQMAAPAAVAAPAKQMAARSDGAEQAPELAQQQQQDFVVVNFYHLNDIADPDQVPSSF